MYKINDIVELKKPHPCSPKSKYWQILEIGGDVRLKCVNCGHVILMKRYDFDTKLVKIVQEEQ